MCRGRIQDACVDGLCAAEAAVTGYCHGCQDHVYTTRLGDQAVRAMLSAGAVVYYNRSDPFFEFSTFADLAFPADGAVWPTVEHYMQAARFEAPGFREQIRTARSPREALALATRAPSHAAVRRDWSDVRLAVARQALAARAGAHPRLRALLAATGDAVIVEHTPKDVCVAECALARACHSPPVHVAPPPPPRAGSGATAVSLAWASTRGVGSNELCGPN